MHDTDSFARMPALDSHAEQPPLAELLLCFERECEVVYRGELYLVRDNGSAFRRARVGARRRRLDEIWTFGAFNRHSGYLEISSQVVHRIVASAFHGPRPSSEYVVDHIDTNRQNNRPANLRWVTRLENILLNPITLARIEFSYGSLDAFFANPGAAPVPNWEWMRTVTKEEAEQYKKRLLGWARKGQVRKGGKLGEWIFKHALKSPVVEISEPRPRDMPSLTAHAVQRHWRTPTAFPQCPLSVSAEALNDYLERLPKGTLFARNAHGDSYVEEAAIGPDGNLSVVCRVPKGIQDWTHARVFVEGATFCHEAGGTFFTLQGAMKAHCKAIGAPFDASEDCIDDCC
jgi:HNH endonuclease